jgi:hypothetical protein
MATVDLVMGVLLAGWLAAFAAALGLLLARVPV